MASPGAIISGAKSIRGNQSPTPAPQGLTPSYGRVSPLAASLQTGADANWGSAYQTALPRPPQTFTDGAFGPFNPIIPVPVDAPEGDTGQPEPRLFQYEVGWNLPTGRPGSEGIKLADFDTLRTLADLYSVARACIQLRKAEVRGLEWDVTPTSDASKAMRGDRAAMKDFGERRAEALRFFRRPDPDYFDWSSFIDAFLEEVFVFDALSLLVRMKWGKGQKKGLLGSDLDSLSLLSGPTIRPLLGLHGERPRPPAPAYQQYLYGVPRTDLMTVITEADIKESGLTAGQMNSFAADQLLYIPMVPRRWTPYGFPPIERALIPVMAGLQKQGYQLDFFREGSIPGLFVSPGGVNANMSPNQLRELQTALNAIAGDPAWKHKIIVLPADSTVTPQRPVELADQFDEVVMNQVCMAFDVQPMELGIMPKVSTSTSPGAANQMSKSSQSTHERKATKPTLTYIANIMNRILQDVCKQPDMRFVFEGLEEDEDEETLTGLLASQINVGLRSIDEGREELGLQPWGLPETSDPGWGTATGFTPLGQLALDGSVAPGQQPNASQPAGAAQPTGVPATSAKPPAAPAGAPGVGGGDGDHGSANAQTGNHTKPKPSGGGGQSPGHDAATAASNSRRAPAGKAPAAKPAATGRTAKKSNLRAAEAELEALGRHLRKGRDLTTWERRHLTGETTSGLSRDIAQGLPLELALEVAKVSLQRRVDLDGQVVLLIDDDDDDLEHTDLTETNGAAGGGGPIMLPHDVNGLQHLPKGAADLDDPNPVAAEHVANQLRRNYPEKALSWVRDARWIGPVLIPQDRIDYDDVTSWAASRDPERVKHFAKEIKHDRAHLHPVVAVQEPGDDRIKVIDGHHRTLAYKKLGQPVKAYVGFVKTDDGPWNETHAFQFEQGNARDNM